MFNRLSVLFDQEQDLGITMKTLTENGAAAKTILAIDDNSFNIVMLEGHLKAEGFTLVSASSGEDGIVMAADIMPDLILLDVLMDGIDGFETCMRLKADPKTAHIPVIFITALDNIEDKIRGFETGGVDYVTKPFQHEELIARLRTHLTIRYLQEQLEASNRILEQRVAERTASLEAANRELERARDAAEAASRAKTEFLNNISHELRTPLNPVIAVTDLMKDTQLDAQQQSYMEMVEESAHELLHIINDLIELSNLEAQDIEPEKYPFSPASVINDAYAKINRRVLSAGLSLKVSIADNLPDSLKGNPDLLLRVLLRLLDNAVKFTNEGEIIAAVEPLESDDKNQWICFSVKDTGVGISPDRLQKIFQDFTQADGSARRRYGGLGLGLTMARKLVDLMGGKITAESTKGQGSTFHVTLPFDR